MEKETITKEQHETSVKRKDARRLLKEAAELGVIPYWDERKEKLAICRQSEDEEFIVETSFEDAAADLLESGADAIEMVRTEVEKFRTLYADPDFQKKSYDKFVMNWLASHVSFADLVSIAEEWKTESSVNWIKTSEQCPEEDDGEWLVTLKSGRVAHASYMADEESDYWRNLDVDDADSFFAADPVIAWAEMPEGCFSKNRSFADYLNEHGLGGMIFPCFEEFLETEYQDKRMIRDLMGLYDDGGCKVAVKGRYSLQEEDEHYAALDLSDEIERLKKKYLEMEMDLQLNRANLLDETHLDCIWYGGYIGQVIDYKTDCLASVSVHGEVRVMDELDPDFYYRNKSNSGAMGTDFYNKFKSDAEYHRYNDTGHLIWDDNNWVECFFEYDKGMYCTSDVLDSDNVLKAFEDPAYFREMFDALEK